MEFHLAVCRVSFPPTHLNSMTVAFAYYIPPPSLPPFCDFFLHVISGPCPLAATLAPSAMQDISVDPSSCRIPLLSAIFVF